MPKKAKKLSKAARALVMGFLATKSIRKAMRATGFSDKTRLRDISARKFQDVLDYLAPDELLIAELVKVAHKAPMARDRNSACKILLQLKGRFPAIRIKDETERPLQSMTTTDLIALIDDEHGDVGPIITRWRKFATGSAGSVSSSSGGTGTAGSASEG